MLQEIPSVHERSRSNSPTGFPSVYIVSRRNWTFSFRIGMQKGQFGGSQKTNGEFGFQRPKTAKRIQNKVKLNKTTTGLIT